eukprot:JP437083.1.p1 GENE.JP437083.1~~JP437083.1.p1  ORF type:complete len:79 (+),score=1.54 JP437083.1:1-237(+)
MGMRYPIENPRTRLLVSCLYVIVPLLVGYGIMVSTSEWYVKTEELEASTSPLSKKVTSDNRAALDSLLRSCKPKDDGK